MRAYRPRLSTIQTLADVLAVEGVEGARIVAPRHGVHPAPALIRVEYGTSVHYLTIPEARAFVMHRPKKEIEA